MNSYVTNTLATYCLPHLNPSILHCHTEYKSQDGQIYRAHPNYQHKPWFDYAMVKWAGYDDLVPSRIHAFLNLNNVQSGSCISFPHSGQRVAVTTPGFYAVIESYDPVEDDKVDDNDAVEVEDDDREGEVDRSIFREFRLSLIPGGNQPILYHFLILHSASSSGHFVCLSG